MLLELFAQVVNDRLGRKSELVRNCYSVQQLSEVEISAAALGGWGIYFVVHSVDAATAGVFVIRDLVMYAAVALV
ncbi:MAG: hypothetical protein ABFD89_17430 [Bryobacteraceae bacterium]